MSSATKRRAARGHLDVGDQTIYEVNVRQYTPEGTFKAFGAHLPRLADLGVGVLWFMPIHPIGRTGRKGTLGSYYAVRDYTKVNPEFGSAREFQKVVDRAHDLGMHVIIDWVANHTAHDHPWTRTHPERIKRDDDGSFQYPVPDWTDTYALDYGNASTHKAMREAMLYWVRGFGIDGFRCDVADMVDRGFWEKTIPALRRVKPMYMLAEGGAPWLHDAGFDASYGWDLGVALRSIVTEGKPARRVRVVVEHDRKALATGDRMHFLTNHDWNSWEWVARKVLRKAHDACAVLSFMLPGSPMIYSGEEAGLDRPIEFFEKDEIAWSAHPAADLYRRLATLKRDEPALRSVPNAGAIRWLDVGNASRVVAFARTSGASDIRVVANLSPKPARIRHRALGVRGTVVGLDGYPAEPPRELEPWGWRVLRRVP